MDCRRRSAVDKDRSRRIRLAVDDDRRRGRWAIDDDRSRIAFYQAQVNKSLDRIDKNLRSIRRMRMPSATIPASLSSLFSSASRKGHRFHNKPAMDDYYPPLELPLRWRDPPPFQRSLPDSQIPYASPRKQTRNLIPLQLDSAPIDTSPGVGYSPNPFVAQAFCPPALPNPHDGIPVFDIQPDPTASTPPLPPAQTELPPPLPLYSRNLAPSVELDPSRANSCSSSRDRPAALTAIHTTGPSPPTALYAPLTDAFHYPTQLPRPDPTTSDDEGSAPQTPVQAYPTMAEGIQQRNAHRNLSAPSVHMKLCMSDPKPSSNSCLKKSLLDGIKLSMSVDDVFDIIFLHDAISYNGDRIAGGPAREVSTQIELDLAYSIEKVSSEEADPEKSRTGGSLSPSASSVKNQISLQQHVRSQMQPTHQTHISLGVSPAKVAGQTTLQLISTRSSNVYFGTILLDMYCRLGMVDAASQVFDSISERNVGSWTAIISGLAQHDHAEEGLVLFNKIRLICVEPNEYTMGSILSACSLLDVLVQERWNQGYVLKKRMSMTSFIGSALWDVYSKCGKVELANQVFDRMKEIYIETWIAMIMGWAIRGCWKEALQCFEDMKCSCIKPDEGAFLAILVACSHAGKVDKGLESFYSMRSRYQIEPGIKHYTCTVDMYGKAGMVNEALEFLNSMSIEPDYVFWGALLSTCQANKNVKIAELAAERLLRLRHAKSSYPTCMLVLECGMMLRM